MFKLASNTPMKIKGVIKDIIEGKARGKLVYCDHKDRDQYIAVKGNLLYSALMATKRYLGKLPEE